MDSRKFSWPFFTFAGNKSCRLLPLWIFQLKSSQPNATCMPWDSFSRLWEQGRFQLPFGFLAHWLLGILVEEGGTPIRLYVFEFRPISHEQKPPQVGIRTSPPCSLGVSFMLHCPHEQGVGLISTCMPNAYHGTCPINGCPWTLFWVEHEETLINPVSVGKISRQTFLIRGSTVWTVWLDFIQRSGLMDKQNRHPSSWCDFWTADKVSGPSLVPLFCLYMLEILLTEVKPFIMHNIKCSYWCEWLAVDPNVL